MKILAVINARSNYACLKSALLAIQNHPKLELKVVCGGSSTLQDYGNVSDLIRKDGLPVDRELYSMVRGDLPQVMVRSMAVSAIDLSQVFAEENPDCVLIVGDRFETLAAAVTAAYMNIPLAHVQGGERSGSIDEKIRHAITKLADIHFPATMQAGKNIAQMGEGKIFVTGCPSIDLLTDLPPIDESLLKLGSGAEIDIRQPYLVVLQHPVTTHFNGAEGQIGKTLEAIKAIGMQTIWLWPNIDSGSDRIAKYLRQHGRGNIRYFRNFPPEQYAAIIKECVCLVGNSSSALRTGAFLGVPAVNIGDRQKYREAALNVLHCRHDVASITEAVQYQIRFHSAWGRYEPSVLYGKGNAGQQIADILAATPLTYEKVFEVIR